MKPNIEDCKELRLFTRKEAAEVLSISIHKLNALIKSGKIEFILIGKIIYIPYVSLQKFIDNNLQMFKDEHSEVQYDDIILVNHSIPKENSEFDSAKYVEQIMEGYIG
ncbi:MAG: helix-turn-helix domain-containing protein [Candidatus Pacearchaeota archaeon]